MTVYVTPEESRPTTRSRSRRQPPISLSNEACRRNKIGWPEGGGGIAAITLIDSAGFIQRTARCLSLIKPRRGEWTDAGRECNVKVPAIAHTAACTAGVLSGAVLVGGEITNKDVS